MRSINITFQHGHLYETDSKKRIIVEEGVNYTLIYTHDTDVTFGTFEKPIQFRSEREIFKEITDDENVTHVKKLFSKGDHLYFFISEENENKDEKAYKRSCFRLLLLEDLFLYSSRNWKQLDLIKGGRLADCACVVNESSEEELPFFENIYAKSVTSAYKKTHVHYFGNAGSPSKNSFDCLYISKHKTNDNLIGVLRGFDEKDRVNKR